MAALRALVLPYGATTGRRLVLDGVNGEIDVYDASDNLVARIVSGEIDTFNPNGSYVKVISAGGDGAEIDIEPPAVTGLTFDPALLYCTDDGTAEHRPILALESPNIQGRLWSTLKLIGQGVTDNTEQVSVFADLLTLAGSSELDLKLNGVSLGRGVKFTSARATSIGVGAQVMVNDPATNFVWRAGRCYKVSFYGRMGTNTAGALAIFKLLRGTTTAASVAIDCGGFKTGAAGDLLPVNISALIANNTGANITQTVQPSLQSSVGTVTWDGGTMPRAWTIEDIGAAADFTNGGNAFNTI